MNSLQLIGRMIGPAIKFDSDSAMLNRTLSHRQIFSIPDLISYMSDYFTLEEGDLILTGTPSGVGPVRGGDVISCEIPGVTKFSFDVVNR